MKTVGIISEYNPFHKGHAYHIEQAKKQAGADFAVIIMNGDFVQRGEPAIIDKYSRTRQALIGGADLVFELPVRFGISSAGDFAYGGILALQSLGFVNAVCFGSEAGNLAPIQNAAHILSDEPEIFRSKLNLFLHRGMSYPSARALALSEISHLSPELLSSPNNILAIEYCIALKQLGSAITPYTITRIGQDYHGKNDADDFFSATTIREQIKETETPHLVLEDFSQAIGYALLVNPDLAVFKDISPDLAERFSSFLSQYHSVTSFIQQCSNSSLTYGRIRRGILQCLLGIKKTEKSMPYLRLLGMKKEASSLLANRENTSCQVLTRLAVDSRKLSPQASHLLKQDISASDLYRQVWCSKYQTLLPNEYQHSPIILA